jgi:hypothetical protein
LTAAGKKGKKGKGEPPSTPGSKTTDEDGLVSVAEAMRSKIIEEEDGLIVSVAEAMRSKIIQFASLILLWIQFH